MTRSMRRRPPSLCLTDLPDDIVLEILSLLNIGDAVRTSALSRAWRHRWHHLPVLDFNRCSFGRLGVVSAAQSVLLRHLAQVEEFALDGSSPPPPVADHPRLDDLLVHLSPPRHALRGLVLYLPSYKLHSPIFSCVKLEYLDLKGCLPPDSTPGLVASLPLLHLTWLRVHYTLKLAPHLNSAQFDALAALISGCPGLEQLAVIVVPEVAAGVTLKIAAPRLRDLQIRAGSADWVVEFQSLLPDLACAKLILPFFRYVHQGGSKLLHILHRISQVESLDLLDSNPLVDFQDMVPFKIPTKFENLRYLTTEADLGDAANIAFILHFLRCCPNIRGLKIKFPVSRHTFHHHFEETQEFWNTHGYGDLFRCLHIMELIDVYLSYNELQFIKLVLSKARVLENFTIVHRAENESSSLEACIEILKFNRVHKEHKLSTRSHRDIKWQVPSEYGGLLRSPVSVP